MSSASVFSAARRPGGGGNDGVVGDGAGRRRSRRVGAERGMGVLGGGKVLRGAAARPAAPQMAPVLGPPPPPRLRHNHLCNIGVRGHAGRGGATTPAAAPGRAIGAAPPTLLHGGALAPSRTPPSRCGRSQRRHQGRFWWRRCPAVAVPTVSFTASTSGRMRGASLMGGGTVLVGGGRGGPAGVS